MAWFTIFRQLKDLMPALPLEFKIVLGLFFLLISVISVYGRINLNFGMNVFSRVRNREEIRKNAWHIFQYTLIPVLVTIYYFYLWLF